MCVAANTSCANNAAPRRLFVRGGQRGDTVMG